MWIKTADHAFNGELKKLLVGDLVNVVVLHGVKDARELTHFHQREFGFSLLVGIDLHAGSGKSAGQSAGDEKRKKTELHWYMFNKNGRGEIPGGGGRKSFCIFAYLASHGCGLMGLPL